MFKPTAIGLFQLVWHFFTSGLAFFVHLDLATVVTMAVLHGHNYMKEPCYVCAIIRDMCEPSVNTRRKTIVAEFNCCWQWCTTQTCLGQLWQDPVSFWFDGTMWCAIHDLYWRWFLLNSRASVNCDSAFYKRLIIDLSENLYGSRAARWPVFERPGRYFTANLAEAGKKPVFWK